MPTMTDITIVPANDKSANLLAGKTFEFAPAPSIVNFYDVASASGIELTILVGGESIMDGEEVSNADRFPQTDTDLIARAGASMGERISVFARNTTGAVITNRLLVEVLPL